MHPKLTRRCGDYIVLCKTQRRQPLCTRKTLTIFNKQPLMILDELLHLSKYVTGYSLKPGTGDEDGRSLLEGDFP